MNVNITIDGEGLSFNKEISFFQATQIMGFIAHPPEMMEKAQLPTELTPDTKTLPKIKNQVLIQPFESPRVAITSLKAKTNPQKIVAIALYLGATSENAKVIENEQILAEFSKAGEPTPKNIVRDIKSAVKAEYIYSESKSSFRLLSGADLIVGKGFAKTKRKRNGNGKTSKNEGDKKLEVRKEVVDLPIVTTLDGYVDYFDIKQRSDEILWILKYAKQNSLSGLNRSEVISISTRVGGKINSGSFASSNVSNKKNGFVILTNTDITITPKGIKHMDEVWAKK